MKEDLSKKVERAIKLIKSAGAGGDVVEVCYSGGKDSDVILELAKMSGIKYRAIYKNTTIDPPYTLKHVRQKGVEVVQPQHTFFELVAVHGFPSRVRRFCCRYLKEYKILDKAIMGVRREESKKRAALYKEPTECRFYGSKKEHVEAFYPILEWTKEDVRTFVLERGIKLHPLYYREDGAIDVSRRLGCMGCPLASRAKRIAEFKKYPRMVRAYTKAMQKFLDTHPNSKIQNKYKDVYEIFTREIFFDTQAQFEEWRACALFDYDYKAFLENYFSVKL